MGFTLLMRNRCFKGRYGGANNHSDWTSFDFDGHKTLLDAAACFANSSTWVAVHVHWRVTSCSTQSPIMICKCQHHRLRCHLFWKTTRRARLPFMARLLTCWRTLSTVEFLSIMEVATWEPVSMHLWIHQKPYLQVSGFSNNCALKNKRSAISTPFAVLRHFLYPKNYHTGRQKLPWQQVSVR